MGGGGLAFRGIALVRSVIFGVEFFRRVSSLGVLGVTPCRCVGHVSRDLAGGFIGSCCVLRHEQVSRLFRLCGG